MEEIQHYDNIKILVFSLDELSYALDLSTIERVVAAVEITPLPKAPEIITGVINYHGKIITVFNIRKLFNLPCREIEPENQFIIAQTKKRLVAIITDSVTGIVELNPRQIVNAEQEFPFTDYISGVANLGANLILINDLDKFLSIDEAKLLEKAIKKVTI
ncbi:MAG: purine-binding chemotaxis protein CheW [Prolixibacteraceae bacterium]|jgi:purine-binding chemotaxis protein CheW|nr:purine-binding chemotaxis protein CheW [Prolixibacteraceae bacterium]MBT6763891.1 purine-binding chemotaxis protein CheW [Prolixibacteraceae bacterium]MBT6999608.1 purine-binding chemotaxis protein CheW [Prolixibacteraceae bacterium]MBT7393824.1 purine-binding chemotaxis protein CheW [Prolixibacteraceae bacterium]